MEIIIALCSFVVACMFGHEMIIKLMAEDFVAENYLVVAVMAIASTGMFVVSFVLLTHLF